MCCSCIFVEISLEDEQWFKFGGVITLEHRVI